MEATESQIRAAIRAHPRLSGHDIEIKAQGSYYNLTHVPRESDVDIRIVNRDAVFIDWSKIDARARTAEAVREALKARHGYPPGPAAYGFTAFRDDVGEALVARFGPPPAVDPGDKAFRVRETRYHVDADVVATLVHRRYYNDGTRNEGVEFISRKGVHIINWPEQQHANGVAKNQATDERFKAMVRALKNLRIEMEDHGNPAAEDIPSFLVECLVWNVPNSKFNHTRYYDDMKEVLRYLYHNTKDPDLCTEWTEESGLKWLFKGVTAWKSERVNAFVLAAWGHVGFE